MQEFRTTEETDVAHQNEDPHEARPATGSAWKNVRETVLDLTRFGAVTALVLTFVAQPMRVEGTSMLPNLHDGERIVVNKFLYPLDGWPSERLSLGRPARRGDVVVLYYPNEPSTRYVKRVIGVPGDTVRIDGGRVYVNGEPIAEPYLSPRYTRLAEPMRETRVREHHYFVMGDNRDNSSDSRAWGLVPERYIIGKAVLRFWPPSAAGTLGN
jgi:signal peptidase I